MRTRTLGSRSSFCAPNLAKALTAAGGRRDDSDYQETEEGSLIVSTGGDTLPARTASLSSTTRLKMKRMYLDGWGVRGPSLPSRCRILMASTVCSQSSMNSHRWAKPVSLLSGFSSMMLMMQSTMARLYSKPPCREGTRFSTRDNHWWGSDKMWHGLDQFTSSLSMLDKKFIMTLCFRGYFWQRALMACTTTTWGPQTHSVQQKKDKEMQP